MQLRAMRIEDSDEVASLIHDSTNRWYERSGKSAIFQSGPSSCRLFCEVYEDLDPGCCVVAEERAGGRLMGSCFYHPRDRHISLGIMNVLPECFGRGVASALLRFVTDRADAEHKPLRLVSSAMNLDSFSLYTRAGFVPERIFQDMMFPAIDPPPFKSAGRVRDATADDVEKMARLEEQACGIRRHKDFQYFVENRRGIWRTLVLDDGHGGISGFLCSVNHPASRMLGPGLMSNDEDALALILAELSHHPGRQPVFLVPADRPGLVRSLYRLGARNCEVHFAQVRGRPPAGPTSAVVMPTFMPETG